RLRLLEPGLVPRPLAAGELGIAAVPLEVPAEPGTLDARNSRYVLNTLDRAISGCLSSEFDALVTGPVHKGIINDAGIAFSGHTEYLADHTATGKVVMMLAPEGLRVALATTHLPLKEVAAAITQDELSRVIAILHQDLRTHFGID